MLQTTSNRTSPSIKHKRTLKAISQESTVLLADDDHFFRRSLAHCLRTVGYKVKEVANGKGLLSYIDSAILRKTPPLDCFSAFVTDVRLPGVTGLSVVEGLRSEGWTQPMIVITSFPDDLVKKRVDKLGDVYLLPKPFDPALLTRMLNVLTGNKSV